MTSQGTASGRFTRAVMRGHLLAAEMAAREMGRLSLSNALSLCVLPQAWLTPNPAAPTGKAEATRRSRQRKSGRAGVVPSEPNDDFPKFAEEVRVSEGRTDESLPGIEVFKGPPGSLDARLAAEPQDAEGCLRLADDLRVGGYAEEALNLYRRATELDPHSVRAWLRKANAYEALNQETSAGGPAKSALKAYARAAQLEPTNVHAWLGQARLLEADCRWRRAANAYSKVTELDSRHAEAWRRQARMLEIEGEKSKAAEVRAKARAAGTWIPEPTIGRRIKDALSSLFESV